MRLNGLDQENLEKELVEYTPGMHLLLAKYDPSNAITPYPAAHIERILALLPDLADLIVLDLGNRIRSDSLEAIRRADQIILCLAAQQASLAMSQSLLESLKQTEARLDRTGIVVVNTVPPSQPAIAHRIETQLQLPIMGKVSPALELAQASAEQEKPMILLQPESSTADQFRELAQAQRVITDLGKLDG
jgi:Flp pilus assembly CpaE family ATPase